MGGEGAVIKCFQGTFVGNFAQKLQNDPLLQLGTKRLLFKVYNRLKKVMKCKNVLINVTKDVKKYIWRKMVCQL